MSIAAGGTVHIAGPDVQIGSVRRQRCAWCGVLLDEWDLARVAVPVGQDPTPAVWTPGGLVLVDGNMKATVTHEGGSQLPDNACDRLPPATDSALLLRLLAANVPGQRIPERVPDNVRVSFDADSKFQYDVVMFRITGDLIREP